MAEITAEFCLANGLRFRLFVDGIEYHGALRADEDAGWAEVLVLNADGNPIHDGEDFKTQVITGRVELVPMEG